MKVSEYVSQRLSYLGVEVCFMVTGGGAMHLNDSLANNDKILVTYNHHEQASAMAAEGYARVAGKPAIVCATTGPGALNTLNGVFGAYTDSVPMIVLAGQVKKDIPAGYLFSKKSFEKDFYLAVPLKKGQLSVREIITGLKLLKDIQADSPLSVDQIDGPYSENPQLRKLIENRGL